MDTEEDTTITPLDDHSAYLNQLASRFRWPDYIVFVLMLAVSAAIGIFYGFCKKQKTTSDFLMAGRSMGVFPMSMSLIASFMSAITLLGTPAEMYQYGTQYWVIIMSYVLVTISASYFYLPVFYNLQVTSAYEYLELRFAKAVRLLGTATFTTQMTIYMAIVVYAPALALSQVTGINVYVATTGIFVVCIFYTTIGGMKAVMWTDAFQVIIMYLAMIAVVIKGAADIGGAGVVWEAARNGSRLEFFNFNLDPRDRHTVWGLIIGGYFTWITIYGVNQSQVQRYLTVPSKTMAIKALWINCFGLSSLLTICCCAGLVIYAKYHGCDPIISKTVKTPDQLFPLFVMDTMGMIPGVPGLFVAGIFSGALSTVSSGLNSLAAIMLEDVLKLKWKNMTERQATNASKYLALGFGVLCYLLVFVAENLGGVLQAALSIFGMVGGPLLGVFTLGMFFPWANSIGAFVGSLSSLVFMMWLGFGANIATATKRIVIPKLEFSVDQCPFNATMPEPIVGESGGVLEFYRISYIWYSLIGSMSVIIIGLIVSFITGAQDPEELNPELISPPFRGLFKGLGSRFVKGTRNLSHVSATSEARSIQMHMNGAHLNKQNGSQKRMSNGGGVDNLAFSMEKVVTK